MSTINDEITAVHEAADGQLASLGVSSPAVKRMIDRQVATAEVKMVQLALEASEPVTVELRSDEARRLLGGHA